MFSFTGDLRPLQVRRGEDGEGGGWIRKKGNTRYGYRSFFKIFIQDMTGILKGVIKFKATELIRLNYSML